MDLRAGNILSLCSGVGGLDLGVRLALPGARTVCYVEREAYCVSVLLARIQDEALDDAPVWTDVKTFDGLPWRGKVDLILGGYPCQPFSVAGQRRGAEDERHLWPAIARIIGEVAPAACFFENVPGHLTLGFREVRGELESMGYRVEAGLFTAAEVGAPHKRERLLFLALADQLHGNVGRSAAGCLFRQWREAADLCSGKFGPLAHAHDPRSSPAGAAAPSGLWSAGAGLPGSSGVAVAHAESLGRQDGSASRTGSSGPAGAGGVLADPEREQRKERRSRAGDAGEEQSPAPGAGDFLAEPPCELFDGRGDDGPRRRSEQPDRRLGLPFFPPVPGDRAGWERLLATDPTLEPALRGDADGLAGRVDRLRACGNGVVPLVAAYALRTLLARSQG